MIGLPVLQESPSRSSRQQRDDSRTALPRGEAEALAQELRRRIKGEVRFDSLRRAAITTRRTTS
jgi:hypothetical protein